MQIKIWAYIHIQTFLPPTHTGLSGGPLQLENIRPIYSENRGCWAAVMGK